MKRKYLLEFADWLAKSRRPFSMGDSSKCVSAQACRFAGKKSPAVFGSSSTLVRLFDLHPDVAHSIYSPSGELNWDKITRGVAADMLRRLVRTGRVEFKV